MEDNSSNKNTVELFEEEKEKEKETEEDLEMLKRSICSHPLYRLLIETHLDCLKMSLLDDLEEADENVVNEGHKKVDDTITSVAELPDLDHFMEAYCRVLGEFKEAMKKPLYGTTAFINDMHSQLKELTSTYPSYTMTPTSPGLEED